MGSGDKPSAVGGFYTVVAHEQHGLFGGLLLLNKSGRPLEFHCTAPIKPNRAQEILYGASLESYLYGEAIGAALLAKATSAPTFLCVENAAALAVREFVDAPVAMVVADAAPEAEDRPLFRVDAAHERGLHHVHFGPRKLALPKRFAGDAAALEQGLGLLPEHFDLAEPFARIRGAIEEAQRSGR
ncbi:MAG: hypothetical protein C0483_04030 [Pirellula sp.]|nr:hypothetical protein [Pirellula sp.]